jgi:WD40-like Beta Propeller Repeat
MREFEGFRPARVAPAIAVLLAAFMLTCAAVAQGAAGDMTLLSRAGGFGGASGLSGDDLAINNNGRWVAFVSDATNLVPGAPGGGVKSVYLVDTVTGAIQLVSRADGTDGAPASDNATSPAISPGGRFVAFQSTADNLSDQDNDSFSNIYVRDTWNGATALISRATGPTGAGGNGNSRNPSVSFDAAVVAFESDADNLAVGADPNHTNVFARKADTQETILVSRANPTLTSPEGDPADGGVHNGGSTNPSISYDGFRIAFQSDATNLSTTDDDAVTDVFLRDLITRSTYLVSCASGVGFDQCAPLEGGPANGDSTEPSLSWDGGFVAFQSDASNLVPEEDHPGTDVFWRGLSANTTRLISRAYGPDGAPADGASIAPTISGKGGQYVAFLSVATNLSEDTSSYLKVFVRDALNGTVAEASRAAGTTGALADDNSLASAISGKGGFVAFSSDANNLSSEDDDGFPNVFLRQLDPAPPPPPPPIPPGPPPHCHLPIPPCLVGGGDAHAGHGGADHAGHTGADHGAGHVHDPNGPAQTLFAPSRQDIDKLYVMVQVHEESTLLVTARVNVPGSSRVYRFKPFQRKLAIHAVRKVKLKLPRTALRAVKRALRHGRKLRARVTATAIDATGSRGVAKDSIILRP